MRYVLSTQVLTNSTGDQLPIIRLATQAPSRAGAEKLASAALAGLSQYLNSKAALERIPDADRLQVDGLGIPQAGTEVRGPSNLIAVLVFVVVFVLGCAGILSVRALVRGWRAAAVREQLGDEGQHDQPIDDGQRAWDRELAPDEPVGDDLLVGGSDRPRRHSFLRSTPASRNVSPIDDLA